MKSKSRIDSFRHGFTLIEVIVVVAVLAVLAAVAIPVYFNYTQKAREAVDSANVKILNSVTTVYAMKKGMTPQTVFFTEKTDQDKIKVLVTDQYLDAIPVPNQSETVFSFNGIAGKWFLAANNGVEVVFQSKFPSMENMKILSGSWGIVDGQLTSLKGGENRILMEKSDGTDYTVDIKAVYLGGKAGNSGYGVYYRATDQAQITGYCFQYDPGIGNDFVVRKVTNGKESAPVQRVDMTTVMGKEFNLTDPHDIRIELIGTQQVITVDGIKVMDFKDDSYVKGSVGLRTWGDTKALFQEITVSQGGD